MKYSTPIKNIYLIMHSMHFWGIIIVALDMVTRKLDLRTNLYQWNMTHSVPFTIKLHEMPECIKGY